MASLNPSIENSIDVVRHYLIMSSAVALVIWYIQFLWKRRYLYIHSWKVEGPFAFPIIGCSHLFLGNGTDIMLTVMKLLQATSPGLLRVWLGPRLYYCISKPEYIETVLNHPKALNKDISYKFFSDGLGFGILTAPVRKWRKNRKILAPAFHRKILDSFADIFAMKSKIFVDELAKVDKQKYIDLEQLSLSLTVDILSHSQMGVNLDTQKNKTVIKEILDKFLEGLNNRIFRIWLYPDFTWHFSPHKAAFERGTSAIHEVTDDIISKRMAQQKEELKSKEQCLEAEIEEKPTYERLGLLDLMLKNPRLTELEIKEEVALFLAAGSDTTATSLCCLFVMLGMHPEVQQKVYEEVIDILGPDRTIEASDFPKMTYTERVLKESLRLFPIVPILGRSIDEDIDLGDAILPAGSSAVFCAFFIHRNPNYWKDPMKFDPDRFLPEEVAKRHPCNFIPFSYGPRNCIGWKYSIALIKSIIASVIRRYRIFTEYKSVEEIQIKIDFTLGLTEGPKVWLEKR